MLRPNKSWDTRSPRLHTKMPLMDLKVIVNRVYWSTNGSHVTTTCYKDAANGYHVVAIPVTRMPLMSLVVISYKSLCIPTGSGWSNITS